MGLLAKLGFIFIILVIGVILLYFYNKPLFYSIITSRTNSFKNISIIMQQQKNFTTAEIKAIASSSPISIKQVLVFGSWKNITQRICGQEQANFVENLSVYEIEYNGVYFPISATIGDILQNSADTNTSLVGQKVYLDFITNNNKNASAPYIINKIYTKGNMFYWILGQDTGVSNSSAMTHIEILDNNDLSATELNGIIFSNESGLISPSNLGIDNGKYVSPNC